MIHFYLFGKPEYDAVIKAFYDGCPEPKKLIEGYRYEPADMAVVYGWIKARVPERKPRADVIMRQRKANRDVIVLEDGYINRGSGKGCHHAVGLNGLNGRADFRNQGMPDDRARLLGVELQPYKQGEHILLCGQVPWDSSVDNSDHVVWLEQCAAALANQSRPVLFRPHPKAALPPLQGCGYSQRPIREDFEKAHAVVTYNSNSGVEALLAGIPAFAFDEGSMVWPICGKDLADLEAPALPDRRQWLNDICYAQWTTDEMRAGLAWNHLFRP